MSRKTCCTCCKHRKRSDSNRFRAAQGVLQTCCNVLQFHSVSPPVMPSFPFNRNGNFLQFAALRCIAMETTATKSNQLQGTATTMLNREQAAAHLGVSESTLAHWQSSKPGYLPSYKYGNKVRYKLSDLEAFIEAHKQEASDEITELCKQAYGRLAPNDQC